MNNIVGSLYPHVLDIYSLVALVGRVGGGGGGVAIHISDNAVKPMKCLAK